MNSTRDSETTDSIPKTQNNLWGLFVFLIAFCVFMSNNTFEYASDTRGTTAQANWIALGYGFSLNGHPSFPEDAPYYGYWAEKLSNGKIVSIYPIAISITSAPFFWLAYHLGFPISVVQEGYLGKIISSFFLSVTSWAVFFILRKRFNLSVSLITVLFMTVGSMMYGRLAQSLWGQSCALMLQALSLLIIYPIVNNVSDPSRKNSSGIMIFLSGFLACWAGACRPSFYLFFLLIFLLVLLASRKSSIWYFLGGCVACCISFLINFTTYGVYQGLYNSKIQEATTTYKVPDMLYNFASLTFSPSRGLIIFSPWIILSFVGFVIALYRKINQPFVWFLFLCSMGILCALAGFGQWWGGWSNGPRLQSDSLLTLTLLFAYSVEMLYRKWWGTFLLFIMFSYSGLIQHNMARLPRYYWEEVAESSSRKVVDRIWDWKTGNLAWLLTKGEITRDILEITKEPETLSEDIKFPIAEESISNYFLNGFRWSSPDERFIQMNTRKANLVFKPHRVTTGTLELLVEGYDILPWGEFRKLEFRINEQKIGEMIRWTESPPTKQSMRFPSSLIKLNELNKITIIDNRPPQDGAGDHYMRFTLLSITPATGSSQGE